MKTKHFGTFLLTVIAFAPLGCTHVHSPERQATAEKLQQQLKSYADNSPLAYTAMIANVEKIGLNEDAALAELGRVSTEAKINNLPNLSGDNFKDEIDKAAITIETLQQNIRTNVSEYLRRINLTETDMTDLGSAILKLRASVQKAGKDVATWNQTVALLKKAASSLPSVPSERKSVSTEDALKHLGQSLTQIGDENVQFQDEKGSLKTKTIKEILQGSISLTDKDNVGVRIPRSPGIKLRILTLGLNVAEAQQDRAMMQRNRLHDRMIVFEDLYKESLLAEIILQDARTAAGTLLNEPSLISYIEASSVSARDKRDAFINVVKANPRDTKAITSAHDQYETELNKTAAIYRAFRLFTVARTITERNMQRLTVEMARLNHLDSIVLSKYNDRIWLLYLQAGVDGLVEYHKGGFSEQDAAKIVSVAQAIAVAILATHGAGGF